MRIAPAIIGRAERDKTIDEVKDMLPQKPESVSTIKLSVISEPPSSQ